MAHYLLTGPSYSASVAKLMHLSRTNRVKRVLLSHQFSVIHWELWIIEKRMIEVNVYVMPHPPSNVPAPKMALSMIIIKTLSSFIPCTKLSLTARAHRQRWQRNEPCAAQDTASAMAKSLRGSRGRAGRFRVKSGCSTCKGRRLKCDETLPICQRCQRSEELCEGLGEETSTSLPTLSPCDISPAANTNAEDGRSSAEVKPPISAAESENRQWTETT
ncbi:uncharacterized protein PAC_06770 [Phialocephala subalpina]|uniref:Zn(2)-C6 fungal-type domain-containing protein n=1 Tax=Phialocephala subalpina TaxID=576137 RepID=A0A1L7WVT7_9HELO|nr:uncharacterized protein PAC_06770 [Phialocephala subalpina]